MILSKLSIINFKNIKSAQLELSPKMNCFIGKNGVGKTNVLDAVFYMSFCKSALNPVDSHIIYHNQDFFVLEGTYINDCNDEECIFFGMKRGQKKHVKRNSKEYRRLSEHIGHIPLVMISPSDTFIIDNGSEERRKFMDLVISQYDSRYLEALNRYNNVLSQRNALLKSEEEPNADIMDILEEQMAAEGEIIYAKRDYFIKELTPVFQKYHQKISLGREPVNINYISHCQRGDLLDVIRRDRSKDRIMGYSLHGIHRDDIEFTLDGNMLKREGSQGQSKTFAIALKFAQFEFLKHSGRQTTPILLLDDIFDKLDSDRVAQIIKIVSTSDFGQIFITDTNSSHIDQILDCGKYNFKIYEVVKKDGEALFNITDL